MNPAPTLPAPPAPADARPAEWVGLHLGSMETLTVTDILPAVFPRDNFVALLTLCRLIDLALDRAGLLRGHAVVTGNFQDAVILVAVSNAPAAAELLRVELDALPLGVSVQIALQRGRDWQCVFPGPEVNMTWLLNTERHELLDAQRYQAVIAGIDAAIAHARYWLAVPDATPTQRASLENSLRNFQTSRARIEALLHPAPEP